MRTRVSKCLCVPVSACLYLLACTSFGIARRTECYLAGCICTRGELIVGKRGYRNPILLRAKTCLSHVVRLMTFIALNFQFFSKKYGAELSECERLWYLHETCAALEYMMAQGVLHRDVAARNILLSSPASSNTRGTVSIGKLPP